MVHDDKLENKLDEGAGKVKEATGHISGDEDMRREGEAEKDTAQMKDKVQDTVEKAKDIFKK